MLYLASRSPRRQQLLQQLGIQFEVLDVDVPEVRSPSESATAYVARVAADKAFAGQLQRPGSGDWILAADTEVVLDDQVFGKPADAGAAVAMLERLSDRTHQVISCVHLLGPQGARSACCQSLVRFAALSAEEIAAYVATGEPFGKAGGYAIQGRAAAFVEHLDGSYSGVMGLPLFETARLLRPLAP
ncbi:Maf family protein [Frateuria aurantia]